MGEWGTFQCTCNSSTDVSNSLDLNTLNKNESGQTIQQRAKQRTRRRRGSSKGTSRHGKKNVKKRKKKTRRSRNLKPRGTRANGFSNDPINLKQKS